MGRRKIPNLIRRRHQREARRRFVVFCEGRNTEPEYFGALRRHLAGALIQIETIRGVGVPYTVADAAVRYGKSLRRSRDSFEKRDEVWAVFDRDNHPRYAEAIALCDSHKIGTGRSNPCFEVWLILHETEYDKPLNSAQTQAYLRTLRPEYDPAGRKCPNCAELVPRVQIAEDRADIQLARRMKEGSPPGPPYTTVGQLTRSIRKAALEAGRT